MEVEEDKQSNSDDDWDQQATIVLPCDSPEEGQDLESSLSGLFAQSPNDPPDGPLLRFQAYRNAWDKCLKRIKYIVRKLHQSSVEDIAQTIQSAYKDPDGMILPSSELVTLLVSSSDRAYVHDCLACVVEKFTEDTGAMALSGSAGEAVPRALVSRIAETDCQSLISLVKALIFGFISQPLGRKGVKTFKPSKSLVNHDMYILRAWYQTVRAHYGGNVPALIVIISDLRVVDPMNLRDLLELCSCHIPHVPLSFLLGSSDLNFLNSLLPRSTLAFLRLERYTLPDGVESLEHVIKETFFSVNFVPDVMLGPTGLEMIMKEFRRHNSTLDALLSTLQLLHIQHFYNPLSFISDPEYDATLYGSVDPPSEQWRPFLRLIRQHYISGLMTAGLAQEQLEWSKLEPQEVIQKVLKARSTFHRRMGRARVAVHVLDIITRFFRARGLTVTEGTFGDIAVDALRGSLCMDRVQNLCNLIRQLKQFEVQSLLEELFHFVYNLPNISRNMENKLKLELVFAQNDVDVTKVVRFSDFLAEYFGQTLMSFDDIICLDVWWTGDISIPNSPLNPNTRISIVTALLEPQEYLGWTECTTSGKETGPASIPDVSILFRRYVESGKMINIYDWYESFSISLENSKDEGSTDVDERSHENNKRKSTKGTGITDEENEQGWKREVQARFMKSMHELEFVGMLKHTSRKVDHVLKTIYDIGD